MRETVEQLPSLDGEASLPKSSCLVGSLDGWSLHQPALVRLPDSLYVTLLRNQAFQDLPAQDDALPLLSSLDTADS